MRVDSFFLRIAKDRVEQKRYQIGQERRGQREREADKDMKGRVVDIEMDIAYKNDRKKRGEKKEINTLHVF